MEGGEERKERVRCVWDGGKRERKREKERER